MFSLNEQIISCGLRHERVMTQDEIVERTVQQARCDGLWTTHRSKRTFIPLIPPAPKPAPASVTVGTIPTISAPEHLDGTLAFSVRTSRPTPEKASPGEVRINVNTHSYPPTPPVAPSLSSSQTLSVPSPHEIKAKLHAITPQNPTTVTHFVFYPSLPLPTSTTLSPAPFAFFSRALAYITPSLPIRSTASFTLAPSSPQVGNMAVPLLTFTDRPPTFSVLTTGLLEINKGIERQLGVDPGFWVAVALAYLEFLTERDSYLAAANG
ncbi:hypothetical protein JB92DRAFT_2946664 [Gautieria morchelliformis]|nr:hypothetical protein JB92DRAFT_2946664 [Gautieria morchelliformis]